MSSVETLNHLPRQFSIKARNGFLLLGKVVEELRDPKQLFDPQRRLDLLSKGKGQLRSLAQPISVDTEAVERLIANDLVEKDISGDRCFVGKKVPIAAVVFSPDTRIRYYNPLRTDREDKYPNLEHKWSITSTTRSLKANSSFPELGYKDSTGIINKFQKRKNRNQSMGGMLVNNIDGTLTVLDYDQLTKEARRNLPPEQVLIMANWYMDSLNQNTVSNIENATVPFNAIGILQNSKNGQSLLFSINSGGSAYNRLRVAVGENEIALFQTTKREVAAMCNLLAKRYGYDQWKLGGVDYNGGGIYPQVATCGYDHFLVYGNKLTT